MELSSAGLHYSDPYTYAAKAGLITAIADEQERVPERSPAIESLGGTPSGAPAEAGAPLPEEKLTFEPLSSRDYFASQGIKLSESAFGNDKLGTQLKSFTAWLKTMKRVQPAPTGTVTAGEQIAAKMAEDSNKNAEVVTEAMAEACLAQGKTQQAKDIYQRLGLENPSKFAYFASKFEALN